MGLLTDTLSRKYEEVMLLIEEAHGQASQLQSYLKV
jgi:hypothetical protein